MREANVMRMSISAGVSPGAGAYGAVNAEADVETQAFRHAESHGHDPALPRDAEAGTSLRDNSLAAVARVTEGFLASLESVGASDAARAVATQQLQRSLEARAQTLLEEELRAALADLHAQELREGARSAPSASSAPSNSHAPLPGRALDMVVELTQRNDVEACRQQMKEVVCVVGNGIRQSVSNATEAELLHLQPAATEATRNGVPDGRVQHSAEAVETDVRKLVASLTPGLSDAMRRMGLDAEAHEAEALKALRDAAVILVGHGLTTPEQARAFLDQVHRHDERLSFLTGMLAQVGYPVGMAAFLWGIAPQLAPSLLGTAGGVPGALAFGALAGAIIGWADSAAGSGASAVYRALAYRGSESSISPLAQRLQLPEARDLRVRAGMCAAATLIKNGLLRAIIPSLVYGLASPAGVNRAIRDHVDFAGDAGGGFFSGGAAALLTRRRLDSRPSRDFKLLTQQNLPDLIQRAQQGDPWRHTLGQSVSAFGRGLGTGALAPSTWAVTGLVMTPLVALLMSINLGLVPKLGWSEGLGAAGASPGTDGAPGHAGNGTMTASPSADMIAVAEHALKATVSTLLMAVLAGGATGVGNWVGRRADADALAAVFGAVRAAAQRLRSAMAPAEGRGAVSLTGVRRRRATGAEAQRY